MQYPDKIKKANILLAAGTMLFGFWYYLTKGLLVKTVASLLFVAIGAVNKTYTKSPGFSDIMMAGIVFAMLGDVVLEINFMGGAALFGLGHIFYLAAYCKLNGFDKNDILPVLCVMTPVTGLVLLYPGFDFGSGLMKIICVVYSVVIAFMVGKARSNHRKIDTKLSFVLLIGSRLFLFSDFMLLLHRFSPAPEITFGLCVNTYYPGQIVLSNALLYTKE